MQTLPSIRIDEDMTDGTRPSASVETDASCSAKPVRERTGLRIDKPSDLSDGVGKRKPPDLSDGEDCVNYTPDAESVPVELEFFPEVQLSRFRIVREIFGCT